MVWLSKVLKCSVFGLAMGSRAEHHTGASNNNDPLEIHHMTVSRRVFMMQAVAASGVVASQQALAQVKLDEKDPQAVALGYLHDSSKVDNKKYPKHAATQLCNNCQLYQGKPADAWGGCPLFGAKQVNGKGWCSAYVKKA